MIASYGCFYTIHFYVYKVLLGNIVHLGQTAARGPDPASGSRLSDSGLAGSTCGQLSNATLHLIPQDSGPMVTF